MLKEKINKIKGLIINKENGDSKKTIENLVAFVVILVITIIAINVIWKNDGKKKNNENKVDTKQFANSIVDSYNNAIPVKSNTENEIEGKLKIILSKIQGVGNVDVLVTYSETSKVIPLYNEDWQENSTEETDKEGGTRKINETSTKKDIVYEEQNGEKTPITQSIVSPKIEGAIITAEGANDATVKANIVSAVEAVTGVGSHKIQVFEMKTNY